VGIAQGNFRPIGHTQPKFHPDFTPIDVHLRNRRREPRAAMWGKKSSVAIIPTSKFGKTGFDITEIRLRQLQRDVVIVEIPKGVAINRKQAVLTHRLLKMQVLDTAVSGIGRKPMLLFELSVVAVHDRAANTELDPVLVLWRLFCCCCHRFSISGFATANCSGGKNSRKTQHKEFARGFHKIEINI
jgi:hypothetical protein